MSEVTLFLTLCLCQQLGAPVGESSHTSVRVCSPASPELTPEDLTDSFGSVSFDQIQQVEEESLMDGTVHDIPS